MEFRNLATLPPGQFEEKPVFSLTRNLRTYTDRDGVRYFLKPDPEGHEAKQLQALQGLNMPLPDRAFWAQVSQTLGVQDSGRTLYSAMREAPFEAQIRYAQQAGKLLQTFHRRAVHVAPEVLSDKPQETAHPIRNFRHRFIDLNSDSTNTMLMATINDMPDEIWNIAQYLMTQIGIYQNRVSDVTQADEDVIYGDFKPENLLVSKNTGLVMIDPELTQGHPAFDVAKFFSRSVIDNFKPSAIRAFVTSYHSEYDLSKPVYGSLSTRDIAIIDLLNIFASYIGRGLQRNSEHRLVEEIRRDGRITNLIHQLSRLSTPSRPDA